MVLTVRDFIDHIRRYLNDIDKAEFTDDDILFALNEALDKVAEVAENYGLTAIRGVAIDDTLDFKNSYLYYNYIKAATMWRLLERIYDQDVALQLKDMDYFWRYQLFKIGKKADEVE